MESHPFSLDDKYHTTASNLFKSMSAYRREEIARSSRTNNLLSLTARDEYDAELKVISLVLAYTELACKRFADVIVMRVQERFQNHLAMTIHTKLSEILFDGDGIEGRCRGYTEDSPELIAKRKTLIGRLDVLRRADQEVRKFEAC